MSRFVPIVVGIADVVNRSTKLEDALEPLDLILIAVEDALGDTDTNEPDKRNLKNKIDSINIVQTWTWPYTNLPGLLSSRLGISPTFQEYTENGGDKPTKLFDQAARRIAKGECRVAVVAGGEALASCTFQRLFPRRSARSHGRLQ